MKAAIYTYNHKYGFFVHNGSISDYIRFFDSKAIYSTHKEAEMAADYWIRTNPVR
jgi:hypothetical protein